MRYVRMIALLLVPLVLLSLIGCGSGSSGTTAASNPFSNSGGGGTVFGNISTATGASGITLTMSPSSVGANNGQVLAIATLVSNGTPVPGASVSFKIEAGPATFDGGGSTTSAFTSSNGVALARITTGDTLITTNVIVKAVALIGTQTFTDYATFQIVRASGVIALSPISEAVISVPATTAPGTPFGILQQIPFTLTDANGNPRVGAPVTLSVQSSIPGNVPVFIDYTTVTTGADGKGIFNTEVILLAPGPGLFDSASIIFQARTHDPVPIITYNGTMYKITQAQLSSAR